MEKIIKDFEIVEDRRFISQHIDEIDEKFKAYTHNAEAPNEHEIMKKIMEELKNREKQTRGASEGMKIAENVEENARNITDTRKAGDINKTSEEISSGIGEIEKPAIEKPNENDDRDSQ